MSSTAQFVSFGPFFSAGALVTAPKLYHYVVGTTTDKDVWTNRTKMTTAAQPVVGDANGVVSCFADGLYKFVVTDSADNTLYTWDNYAVVEPCILSSDWTNVKDYGAIGDGTGNDGPAIRAACNAGSYIWFPPGTYRITDDSLASLTAASHGGITLMGCGVEVTILNFENGANDCIKADGTNTGAGQFNGFRISSMSLKSTGKTGGRMIAVSYAYKTVLDHLYIECWTGIESYITNNFDMENVVVIVSGGGSAPSSHYGPAGQAPLNCYGLFWHAPSDGTGRCDGLRTENLIIQGNFSGSDGILMDGLVATWDCITCGVLNSDYGVRIRNTGLNATSNFTNFIECHNLAIEGAKSQALRIEAGVQMRFIGCNFNNQYGATNQGSADTNTVEILADLTYSETRAISFIGCVFHSCKNENVVTAAKSVRFEGCLFNDAGRGASNTYSALKIATNSEEVTVIGNNIGVFGANNDYKYGIEVAATTYRVGVIGNNIYGFGTKAIIWEGNDAASMCFGNFGQGGPISQDPVPYGVPKSQAVTVNFTATAAQVLNNILLLSGTPGAFDMTMPTAANLVAGLHSPMLNGCFPLLVINTTNGTCTIKTNTGASFGGNKSGADFTIATGVTRPFTIHIGDVRSASAAYNLYG